MNKICKSFAVITLGLLVFFQISINFSLEENMVFPTISMNISGVSAQDAEPVDKIYEGAPNGEINYTLYASKKKYCSNRDVYLSYEDCEDDDYQSCPGMEFGPEPSCWDY